MVRLDRGEAANHGITDVAKLVGKLVEVHEGKVGLREAVDGYEEEVRTRTRPAVLLSRKACVDAHDWKTVMRGESPLMARRAVSLKKDA
jgi:2-polyprenyl-6-methoxyphenol hydroxylase-like FAD-dependent oxidoreductase